MHAGFSLGNVRESVHFECLCVDERIILKWIFNECDEGRGMV